MTKQPAAAVFTALTIGLFSVPTATAAFGKQQCTSSMPPSSHEYWSWRLIDGRKCWYEGKPMLSKASLEWPAKSSLEQPAPAAAPADSDQKPANAPVEKPGDPLDAQARSMDSETFDALWRARIDRH